MQILKNPFSLFLLVEAALISLSVIFKTNLTGIAVIAGIAFILSCVDYYKSFLIIILATLVTISAVCLNLYLLTSQMFGRCSDWCGVMEMGGVIPILIVFLISLFVLKRNNSEQEVEQHINTTPEIDNMLQEVAEKK